MRLSQLVYVSDAVAPMVTRDLERLLTGCRRNNGERHITGLLIYSRGHFMQLLEGDDPALRALYQKISKDPRHLRVQQLLFQPAPTRLFPKWQMGLVQADRVTDFDRQRLLALIHQLGSDAPAGTVVLRLLHEFRNQLPGVPRTNAMSEVAVGSV